MTMSRGPTPLPGQEHRSDGAVLAPAYGTAYGLERLGRSWTWLMGSAVATLVPGVLILVWPEATLHVLAVLVGLYLLVNGMFRFVAVFGRKEHGERLPGLLMAVVYVLAGVLCLRNPLQTITVLSLVTGVVWLVSGILSLYTAIVAEDLPHRGVVLGAAMLGIVAGIVVLALPAESARALTRLLGLWLVLLGLAEAAVALAWRAALRKTHAAGAHTPSEAA
ncbi:membrane protein [Streptomyces sp. NRRL B-1140]|uniref:HdeD family acid-resistance protein n=1 Tax=Streptomyces sp. NRRL B-1140 TaxID=1415549 RepID=UPI0006AF0926|nr:HdeD family acid-resistance protein [Streptomyces sp. NRRL B-1140]KOX02297.1 membrane protein [Streptomyces sp. NRRL B-1140]